MPPPLKGIRILDLTRAMAGPFCTQLLGDLGAEIIKIESMQGDETRFWGPFWNDVSCYFLSANRNKQSIALDLKAPAGRQIVQSLAEQTDILIENFRPGTATRLGLGYETLAEKNPGLVYCSISGFGQDGPRAFEPAYDLLMQAFSGLMSLTGLPSGETVRAGLPVTDLTAGMYAAIAILSALIHRQNTGEGQKVETSLLEGQIAWLSYYLVGYFANGVVPKPMGSAHHSLAPYGSYEARDGSLVIAVGNDTQWKRLCHAIGAESLGVDERFLTNEGRLAHRQEMDQSLNSLLQNFSVSDLMERIKKGEVPCGPINTIDKVVQDPQVTYLNMVESLPHPQVPDLVSPRLPINFSKTPGCVQSAPPLLGEHTEQILQQLGYNPEEIQTLRDHGVVA